MLSSKGVSPNRCSPIVQKILRNPWTQQSPRKIYLFIYLCLNEPILTKIQVPFRLKCRFSVWSCTFTGKIKFITFHRYLSRLFLELFKNSYFAEHLLIAIDLHELSSLSACSGMFQGFSFKTVVKDCSFK